MGTTAEKTTRRELMRLGLGAILTLPAALRRAEAAGTSAATELKITDHLSPKNKRRPLRPHTLYIVLHTTEGAEAGSLDKLWRRGEAHYFVETNGRVLRIIDRAKIATHAGRSMWEGHRNIDNYALGIEVVGYHDREINEAQYAALGDLLRMLQRTYRIADKRVLTHSMVAYGRPNRFHLNDHRGRKRCGMIFARADVRLKLGLAAKPEHDADVEARRLVVADAELYHFLYAPGPVASAAAASARAPAPAVQVPAESNLVSRNWTPWHIARERYNQPDTTYVFPDGRKLRGDQIQDWNRIPEGTRVLVAEGESENEPSMEGFLEIGKDGDSAQALAGEVFDRESTIYFLPNGLIRTGRDLRSSKASQALLDRLPQGTRVLVGYIYGGYVRSRRPPSSIAGIKWNYPSTFYRFPDGRIVSGDEIDDAAIPAHTLIFYQN
ncbi:MAG: N-acetylmuramoyl-L-alanine amidase [Acidobacteriia bacterium]|nr:N-acetylmuramoyl-L-alanine amidase [Terriglobia bacterium]